MASGSGIGEGSNWEYTGRTWAKYWKTKVSENAKLLGWRVFNNAIPVMRNLFRRGVGQNKKCSVCGYEDESIEHIFMDCWWAKCLWQTINIDVDTGLGDERLRMDDWLWKVFTEGRGEDLRMVLIGLQMIWSNRNSIAHGNQGWPVSQSEFKIRSLLSQFDQRGLLGYAESGIGESIANEGWEVLCDGSWAGTERCGGWAAILFKDAIAIECRSGYAIGEVTGLQTEMNALLAGLRLVEKHGGASAIFYSDCVAAVWILQKGERHKGLPAEDLSTAFHLLTENPGWKIRHILREDNQFADSLARKARIHRWRWEREDAIPFAAI